MYVLIDKEKKYIENPNSYGVNVDRSQSGFIASPNDIFFQVEQDKCRSKHSMYFSFALKHLSRMRWESWIWPRRYWLIVPWHEATMWHIPSNETVKDSVQEGRWNCQTNKFNLRFFVEFSKRLINWQVLKWCEMNTWWMFVFYTSFMFSWYWCNRLYPFLPNNIFVNMVCYREMSSNMLRNKNRFKIFQNERLLLWFNTNHVCYIFVSLCTQQ